MTFPSSPFNPFAGLSEEQQRALKLAQEKVMGPLVSPEVEKMVQVSDETLRLSRLLKGGF